MAGRREVDRLGGRDRACRLRPRAHAPRAHARANNKLPYDLYREAVASFRRRSERLDIYRLQDYAEAIPHGEAHLERAMEEVF